MFDVFIEKKENKIYANILVDGPEDLVSGFEYAFYLYKDDIRVEVKWYTGKNETIFDVDDMHGVYYVKGFLRSKEKKLPSTKESERIMHNKIPYDINSWEKDIYNIDLKSIEYLTELKNGIYHIDCNIQGIDILVDGIDCLDKNKGFLVCFSGAVTNREYKYAPFFSGLNIAKKLEMPIICVSDPSLSISNECNLAWYAGNKDVDNLPETIAYILDKISERLNTKLIVFGGSGGGFATLAITRLMSCEHSSLVWNPQTSITEYNKRFVSIYINNCLDSFYTSSDMYPLLDEKNITHDLVKEYSKKSSLKNNNILYLQNSDDIFHVENHLKPFMNILDIRDYGRGIYKSTNDIVFWIDKWGDGHSPPSLDILINALNGIINMKDNLDTVSELLEINSLQTSLKI